MKWRLDDWRKLKLPNFETNGIALYEHGSECPYCHAKIIYKWDICTKVKQKYYCKSCNKKWKKNIE